MHEAWLATSHSYPISGHCQVRKPCTSILMACHALTLVVVSDPDLVYNRQQRATPSFFRPRRYFKLLGEQLFRVLREHYTNKKTQLPSASLVFRMFSDKMIRVGQREVFVQAWLSALDSTTTTAESLEVHSLLLKSLPDSCYEAFFLELANATPSRPGRSAAKYRLIELMPENLCATSHFQYTISHKLLLAKPFSDLYFSRVLVDVLARVDPMRGPHAPLCNVFDVVLSRWSQDGFPTSADYALNASICFFLRYSLRKLGVNNTASFEKREWTAKLCKGVQDHMAHSVERVRTLGMRVGESLSAILSPDNLLDFGIEEEDPLDTFGSTEDLESLVSGLAIDESARRKTAEQQPKSTRRRKKAAQVVALDLDELVESDDDDGEELVESDGEDSGSDSDVSLDAYDLEDDEEDMTARRPLYLKDLITGLQSDEDRDKTEAALTEAEALLRKKPRDLHDNANAVVAALLRLEDKFSTPNFNVLRSKALAAVVALSPQQSIPYLQSQALEREQLLQSRIDALEAMVSAAQELSETGIFAVTQSSKKLLQDDLDTRTMQGLKTRRWGYRRDPLAPAKKNAFADQAIGFFSPLLFGYAKYVQAQAGTKGLSDLEQVFLAHMLHALACFVECAGHAPQTISMAKCLLEFAWHERNNSVAAVRRQVLFCLSRVLLVVPPFLLRQEMGENVLDMMAWLQQVRQQDPDEGCREGSRLLLSSGSIPMITQP